MAGTTAFVALTLVACASTPTAPKPAPVVSPLPPAPPPPPPPPAFTATPGLSPRERVLKILSLLNDGQPDQARAEAQQLMTDQPGNTLAQSLFDQVDKDPKLLLGEKNFPYKIQPGETLSILAQRYLGDRFLFYALARYNGLDKPGATEVGQTIMIPGTPGKIAVTPVKRKKEVESDAEAVDARLAAKRTEPPPAPTPVKPVRDVQRASALRGQALALLNGGSAGRAAALLREAARLDPESAAIKRDLSRAERIQAAMQK